MTPTRFTHVALAAPLEATAPPWLEVQDVARERGLRLMTSDRVGDEGIDPRQVLLVAADWTPDARRLVAQGARPAALISFDSPVVAWWLYYHLEQVSDRFPHSFLFEGARDRVAPTTRFHPLYFPQPCPPPRPTGQAWSKRRLLVMIDDNRAIPRWRDLARWFDRPREVSLLREWAGLQYRPILRDRYRARLRAIEAFSRLGDFDLFGEGWAEKRHPAIDPGLHAAAQQTYRGTVRDAPSLLAGYRFALVFENTRFPGYVSERVFECFFARCIPIYSGAPDVAQYRAAGGLHRRPPVRLVRRSGAFSARHHRGGCQTLPGCGACVPGVDRLREPVQRSLRARHGRRARSGWRRIRFA